MVSLIFKSSHYFVFGAHIIEKRLLVKRKKHKIVVLDMFGRSKVSLDHGEVLCVNKTTVTDTLDGFFNSKHFGIMSEFPVAVMMAA